MNDAPTLTGKVAVITGASRGIGAVTAKAMAAAGASVALGARDAAALTTVAREITDAGGRALAVPTDVGDPAAVERLVQRTLDEFGRLDLAFNNAAGGGNRPMPLADIPLEAFDSALQVNLRGIFLALKYEIPAMLRSGGGAIVNMSSTGGVRGVPGIGAYVASKHGVVGLTKTAALDYARQNIRINVVVPGPIYTHRLEQLEEPLRQKLAARVPLHRLGEPEEVAATVVWLCSDHSSFLTGATIPIDGGQLAALA